jgi:hypothetical protein
MVVLAGSSFAGMTWKRKLLGNPGEASFSRTPSRTLQAWNSTENPQNNRTLERETQIPEKRHYFQSNA